MELLIIIVIIVGAAWLYSAGHQKGKQVGSRKGYGVGYQRASRHREPSGCLGMLLIISGIGIGMTVTGAFIIRLMA